jgi:hypothetical protein
MIFLQKFSAKILKNHNIGPRLGEKSPNGRLFALGSYIHENYVHKQTTYFGYSIQRSSLCVNLEKGVGLQFGLIFPKTRLVTLLLSQQAGQRALTKLDQLT